MGSSHLISVFLPQAFADTIRAELDKFPSDVRDDVVILFSAHSLPLKVKGLATRLTQQVMLLRSIA